jgi:ribosomal protein S12 methylthiotransferase accessory factor
MAPPQLFIAALGGCAGVYVADFCDSQGIDYQGLRLNVDWDCEDRPRRISSVHVRIELSGRSLTAAQVQGMLDAVQTCTLQNRLAHRPQRKVDSAAVGDIDPRPPLDGTAALCEDGGCCRPAH